MSNDGGFESVYNRVSSRANYLLVANGVILAAIISAYWQCTNITFTGNGSAFIFALSLLCIFLSSGFCMGAFNSGIYTSFGVNRTQEEYQSREDSAIHAYQAALFFIGLGLIGIFTRFVELINRDIWQSVYIILFSIYLILIVGFHMFGRFGLSPLTWVLSLPSKVSGWQESTWKVIVIEIIILSIAVYAISVTSPLNPGITGIIVAVLVLSALCLQLIATLNDNWKKIHSMETS